MLWCAILCSIHATYDRKIGVALIQRWRPQPAFLTGDQTTLEKDIIGRYGRARVLLEKAEYFVICSAAPHINVFVTRSLNKTHVVESCLWHPKTDRVVAARSMGLWHQHTMVPEYTLRIGEVSAYDKSVWLDAWGI